MVGLRPLAMSCLVALLGVSGGASASGSIADDWFLKATSFNAPGTSQPISKPDFLGSSDWENCARDRWPIAAAYPAFYGVWSLLAYDPAHGIALARGFTDQCSLAVFKAARPSVKVANVDLSQYSTARGLRIGSPYSQVLAVYGPPKKHGARFVASYSALVPAIAVNKKPVKLDQRITLVVVDGYVSSISIYIDAAGLY